MTVAQAIKRSALLYPVDIEDGRVYSWLSELEGRMLLELYGKSDFTPITSEDSERELWVCDAYAELYPLYLVMKTDLANGDSERYANSVSAFKAAYSAYANFVNRTRSVSAEYNKIELI